MKGILTWATEVITETASYVYTAASTAYSVGAATANFLYSIPYTCNDYLVQPWQGASTVVDKETASFLLNKKSHDTRVALMQSVAVNVGYAALTAVYAGPVKNLLNNLPCMDNPYVQFSVDMLANAGIYGLWMLANNRYANPTDFDKQHPFIAYPLDLIPSMIPLHKLPNWAPTRLKINLLTSDVLLNTSMATVVTRENEKLLEVDRKAKITALLNPTCNEPYKPCGCRLDKKIKANIVDLIYFMGEQASIWVLKKILPYGEYVTLPLQALSLGKMMMEYKLASVGDGMCTRHRREILNQNNLFALGFGGVYMALSEVVTRLIMSKVGSAADFKDEIQFGVNGFLMHWFIMLAILQGRRYPGSKAGTEVFHPSRLAMKWAMKYAPKVVQDAINEIFGLPEQPCDFRETLAKIGESREYQLASKVMLTKDMQHMVPFLRTPPVRFFFDKHTEQLRNIVETIRKYSQFPGSRFIPAVTKRIPVWILSTKKGPRHFLCFFFSGELRISLFQFEKDLKFVRSVQLDEFAKVTQVRDAAALAHVRDNYSEPTQAAQPERPPEHAPVTVMLDPDTTVTSDEDNIIETLIEDYDAQKRNENKPAETGPELIHYMDMGPEKADKQKITIFDEYAPVMVPVSGEAADNNSRPASPLLDSSFFTPRTARKTQQDPSFAAPAKTV